MKIKNIFRFRKENGAITVWSAVLMTVLMGFTALSIDIGLHHYMGAKLQNAVDSAATAVASSLGSADNSLYDVAYEYLAKNGYDKNEDKYKDNLKVTIEQKGVANEETMYEGEYITTGYYKITVALDDSTLFANVLDIHSLHLEKTAYVKCEANYVEMPKALKYTIFGASTSGTETTPTVDINGRTNDTINQITASFEGFINGVNRYLVQPIIGIFGGQPNYNNLVRINLSEVITDGDVHSNSNIAIGVQALNASRVKDKDYDGAEQYNPEAAEYNSDAYDNITVDMENAYDDYGQVTYTAVGDIIFDSSLKSTNNNSTHVYVQNQQYLEITQATLNILNTIDFKNKVNSLSDLKNEYDKACDNYFSNPVHKNISDSQKAEIRAQADNFNYGAKNSYSLLNQGQVVYNVSQQTAEDYLNYLEQNGIDDVQQQVNTAGLDNMFLNPNSYDSALRYQNYADTKGSINYGIKFTKDVYVCSDCGYESTTTWTRCPNCAKADTMTTTQPADQSASIVIQGTQVNRDVSNLQGSGGASMSSATLAGSRFALVRTFQEHSEYITVPNMKPYFTRQVNTSIRSATQTYEEFTDPTSQATGDKTVKMAVARLSEDVEDIKTDTSYEDDTYQYTSDYTNLETTPLFKYYQASQDSARQLLTGTDRTVFHGYSLFNSSGILKDAATHIAEFKSAEFADGNLEETNYGFGAINTYYNDNIADNENDNYDTNYAADAVKKKRAELSGDSSEGIGDAYEEKQQWINDNITYPSEKSVFLVKNDASYVPTQTFNEKASLIKDNNLSDLMPTYSGTSVITTAKAPWANGANAGTYNMTKCSISSGQMTSSSTYIYNSGNFTSNNSFSIPSGKCGLQIGNVDRSGKNCDVGRSGGSNATLIVTGYVNSDIVQVRRNSTLYVYGNITCNNIYLEDGAKIVCGGQIEIKNHQGNSDNSRTDQSTTIICNSVYINTKGKATASEWGGGGEINNFYCNFYVKNDFTSRARVVNYGTLVCMGNFVATEKGNSWKQLVNYGQIYVYGNMTLREKLVMEGSGDCCLYVCGNVEGSNIDDGDGSAYDSLHIMNDCKVYIGGYMGSTASGRDRRIWIEGNGTQSAVLSVYGGFYNIDGFYNEQYNSNVYLKGSNSHSVSTTTAGNEFHQYGNLYCYSTFTIPSNTATFLNSGKTMVIGGDAVFENTVLTVPSGHTFYCSGKIRTKGVKATDGGKIYGMSAIELTADYSGSDAGCLTTESSSKTNLSEVFCGPDSIMRNGMGLNINGYIYYPGSGSDLTVKRLNIGGFGSFVTESNLNVRGNSNNDQGWFYIEDGGMLYVGGLTSISYCRITNYGKMYLMGGYNPSNIPVSSNTTDITLGANADTFIGSRYYRPTDVNVSLGNLVYSGYFEGNGNLYIENNLIINGNTSTIKTGNNRNTGFLQNSGNTYVSGYISTPTDQGVQLTSGTSVSCQKNFTLGSALYNYGKLYVIDGNLIAPSGTWYSDKKEQDKQYLGVSVLNGESSSVIYVGGSGTTYFKGYVENYGKIYHRGTVDVTGYNIPSEAYFFGARYTRQANTWNNQIVGNDENYAPHLSIRNGDNAEFHAYSVNTSAMIHNQYDAELSTQGNCLYGMCILNGGKFVAFGDVRYSDHQYKINGTPLNHLEVFRAVAIDAVAVRMGGYAIVNGFASGTNSSNARYNPNALFYAGGSIDIGSPSYKNTDSGDAVDIGGTVQNWGTMYIDGDFNVYATFQLSYNVSTLLCQPDSNTFVNGSVWVSAVSGIMEGSIFMCQDDYHSRRSTKIGISDEFDNNDPYRQTFFYTGGNMYANLLGASGKSPAWFGLGGTSNTNAKRDLDIYSNSNVYVYGSLYANSKVFIKDNCNVVIEGQKDLYERDTSSGSVVFRFINTIIEADRSGVTSVFAADTVHNDNYHFFVGASLDARPNTTIIANGSTYVRDTTKIRDMTKTYINGNFYCANYVEIGKSLFEIDPETKKTKDETEAANPINSTADERANYKFSNAGYMYVGGNFNSSRYTKIYASTHLKVKDDFTSGQYLTLRHDAEIDVGKKLKAFSSIDGGVYSTFRVNGSMEASTSFIKLRDRCDCFVGGDMTAMSYIELGKYDETIQDANGARLATITAGVNDGGVIDYKDKDDSHPEYGQEQDGGTNAGADGSDVHEGEAIVDQKTIDTRKELSLDSSDLAQGGQFYIGKKLVTYTGYIKEFAYSRVAVGNYIFAPKYITLRSNADMWVLPPSFGEDTYEHIPVATRNDGTILGWILDRVDEFKDTLQDTFAPHNGSIYTLGELTLNKNASLFGTYDCKVYGQCVLRQSSLIYLGHNFNLSAPSLNLSLDVIRGSESVTGFDTYGTASANGYTFPAVVYADNEINIVTTIDMKLTYLVANRGDVNLYNVYSKGENAERNAKQLPNAICSYQGDVNYNAVYGKLGALMYAPNGNVDLDGYYSEIWGSIVGDRVITNTYYMALHRFTNWRTMDLQVAESGSVYLISQNEYEATTSNVDDIYMFDETSKGDNPTFVPGDRPFYY